MKETKKTYWKGLEQLTNDPEFVKYADKEFAEYLPVKGDENTDTGSSRRDFLKLMGFSVAAASVAACEAPVRKAIPYLNKPVDVDPGVPNFYASTYMRDGEFCSILVKTREGRPIKVEGNDKCLITKGGTSSRVEASVLSLYDDVRYRNPQKEGQDSDWSTVDKEITSLLAGGSVGIVSQTILSPSTKSVLAKFTEKYPNTKIVQYDAQSASGVLEANQETFGKAVLPSLDFSKADVIVGFNADFLGTWVSPVEYTKQYSQTRKLSDKKKNMSRHYQFEANMTITGASADYRSPIKPSQFGPAVVALYNALAKKAGVPSISGGESVPMVEKAAEDLWKAKGKSLVVSGSNDKNIQLVVNAINSILENYGATINIDTPSNYRAGIDSKMDALIADLNSGKIKSVIFLDCNPVYNHPKGAQLAEAIKKAPLSVSTSDRLDETSSIVKYVAAGNHFLENWGDAEPKSGHLTLMQPAISKLFNTRQAEESLLAWAGVTSDYYNFVKDRWVESYFANQNKFADAQIFFDSCLHDGIYHFEGNTVEEVGEEAAPVVAVANAEETQDVKPAPTTDLNAAASNIAANSKSDGGFELSSYFSVGLGDGSQANNPWLQEMPDPITKATWDNYLTISQPDAAELGITMFEGKSNMAQLTVGGNTQEVPVLVQPGQAKGTVGIALGYGRTVAGKVADGVGVNVYPWLTGGKGNVSYDVTNGVSIAKSENVYQVAQTQTHETYMNRDFVIQESVLTEYQKNPSAGRYSPQISTWKSETGGVAPGMLSLWKGHDYPDHHWGLAIDLNSCTGCGTCTIACQAENNIPVVGRDEVINRREMHWMRIDRYYSSDAAPEDWVGLEKASENPEVTFQPMMCQHCNNAPCETVCPVAATAHSTEGLNQMVYNRCIGTRYCANNCPYKVRRFNWFKYHDNSQFADSNTLMNSDLGKMVLNPDVTVRSRGVMEKCSLCVQRIQYGKLEAKKERREMVDGDVNTACASSCPADALVFGDLNDDNSRISKMLKIKTNGAKTDKSVGEERAYTVLEEIGVKPNVLYLTKIRNKDTEA